MRVAIMVMRARDIEDSLKSIQALPYSKVWVEYHREKEIQKIFPQVLGQALERGYSHLAIISDDGIVDDPEAADAIFTAALSHQVVCGWCYDSREQDEYPVPLTNMSKKPLDASTIVKKIDQMSVDEILNGPPLFRTYFSGLSLHTMSLDLWRKYPFQCYMNSHSGGGRASDFHICKRLQDAGIEITAVREGKIRHLGRKLAIASEKHLYCGQRPKAIRWEEV